MALFKRMADVGKIYDRTKFNQETKKLYVFKPQPHRFFCFFVKGKRIIIVSAYQKQGDKAPPQEISRAENLRLEWRKSMRKNKGESTLDREMKNPAFRAAFEKEFAALEVSEFLAKQMAEQEVSVRTLAARASVSPTIVQGIKSGKRKNIEYTTLKALTLALGYQIKFKRMHTPRA